MARREINIFSVSLLDLLAGALGAVIILYVVIDKNPYKTSGGFEEELIECDSSLQGGLEELEAKIDGVKNDLPRDEYRGLKDEVDGLKNDITCFREIIDKQEKTIAKLEIQLANARDSIRTLQGENARLRRELAATKQTLAETQQELEETQQQLAETQQTLEETQQKLAQCEQEKAQLEAQVEQLQNRNQNLEADLRSTRQELARWKSEANFLVIILSWQTRNQDVDLHVYDPSGAEFFFQKKTVQGRRGELTEDDTDGPGMEIWQINGAYNGTYQIKANLYDKHGNSRSPVVTCKVFYRGGVKTFTKTLTREKVKENITNIYVGSSGAINFN